MSKLKEFFKEDVWCENSMVTNISTKVFVINGLSEKINKGIQHSLFNLLFLVLSFFIGVPMFLTILFGVTFIISFLYSSGAHKKRKEEIEEYWWFIAKYKEKKKKNIIRHCYGLLSLNFFCFLIYQDYHFLTFFILNYILFIIMGWQKYDLNESDD